MKNSTLVRTLCVIMVFLFTTAITTFASNATDKYKETRTLAKKGNVEAQVNLAELYIKGEGVEKDIDEAINWYRKAAKEKHIPAMMALGNMYFEGNGVDKDEEEAFKWYTKAAEQGNANAQYILGVMYENGRGVPKDDFKAVEWYRKSADQGHAAAQCNLGWMYANGRGVAKDVAKTVEWITKAAEQGSAQAQCNLGLMYANGLGVDKDEEEAFKWYTKAAEQGNAKAQYILGWMYANGLGVAKDEAKAVEWYTKAAEQGNADAQNKLAILKSKPRITPEIIEGFWTNVLEKATRITVAPRSKEGADAQKGEGMLEAFGVQYMPNAYKYYQDVRAKAIEREQMFRENFPKGFESDNTGGKLYQKVGKATAKAVAEYFRRRDELCYFYLMHKAGIMNSEELMKLDEAKISMILPALDEGVIDIKVENTMPSAEERTFAEKYMPSALKAFDSLSNAKSDNTTLLTALQQDLITLDALRGKMVLNVIISKLNLIQENQSKLISSFKKNKLLHAVDEITVEELLKHDERLSVEMRNLDKRLPIREYSKEWLASNWTDAEMSFVIAKEVPLFGLQFTMASIPNKDYLVCKYEVTQGLWQAVMGNNPSRFKGDLKRPVDSVSWDDCQKFIEKLNSLPEIKGSGLVYRLPREEEWEYACRAGATGEYCKLADGTEITKETLGKVAWDERNPDWESHPVGQKMPNAFGLYDMHGNVWEWCLDEYDSDFRILRGGCWNSMLSVLCLSANRCRSMPYKRYHFFGIRLFCFAGPRGE